jgi:hypothetical protein
MSAFGTKRTSQQCFAMSAFGGIVLQKSFCIVDHKISEPWARFSCKDVGGHMISRLTHL